MSGRQETLDHRLPSEGAWARLSRQATRIELGPRLAGTALPFALVVFLALEGGGYDAVVRSEVGLAVWWIVLLGALVGLLPAVRPSRAALVGLGALAAFALWTALAIAWSDSAERGVAEVARVATYLGVLVLAIAVQGEDGLRRAVYAIGAALAFVGALALLSRLHPGWFPADETAIALESARARLNYPVNYWNGLAALMAIGLPLVLAIATDARRIVTAALATAAVPVMALVAYYTLSRGGVVEIAAAIITFVVLYPRRLAALPTLMLGTLGGVLLIAAATQRDELADGLSNPTALAQGDEMLAVTLVVCAGTGLLRAGVGIAARSGVGPRLAVGRRATRPAVGVGLASLVVALLLAGASGELADRWEEFKNPSIADNKSAERFESASGNGRYQYWQAALDANATAPVTGVGPGTYEYFWAREGTIPGFVRDAHSLFFEVLAEVGIVGLLLIGGFAVGVIAFGVRGAASSDPASRPWLAAGTAASVGFGVAAAVDWVWELAVVPVAFLLLAAAILTHRRPARDGEPRGLARIVIAVSAVAAIVAIAVPLAGTLYVRASKQHVDQGLLDRALDDARRATEIQPWAASSHLQEALVLELQGNLDAAATAARAATEDESTNWRTWLVLSRIETHRGESAAGVDAYREARDLNPRSPLFER
ncbi:MAG TPA: O-antigen ligase family protein [Solirubrobacterales bacterium]|nr:O-antigen ligase family protein [Solirubrobacterales bacterium]